MMGIELLMLSYPEQCKISEVIVIVIIKRP